MIMRPIRKLVLAAAAVLVVCIAMLWLLRPDRDDVDPDGTTAARFGQAHGHGAVPEIQRIRSRTDAWSREQDLPGPVELTGTVVDEANAPVAGATVTVTSQPPRTATTDQDGAWAIKELLPRPYRLEAHKDDSFARLGNVVPQTTPRPIVLRLTLGAEVRVRVVDGKTQAPIAGAHVQIRGADSSATSTDDAGWARFRGAPPVEAFVIAASKDGWTSARKIVGAGLAARDAQVFHVELARATTVSGRVVDQSGRTIANATVVATSDEAGAPTDPTSDGVRTDSRGEFTLRDVAPGNVSVKAFHPDFRAGAGTQVAVLANAPVAQVIVTMRRALSVSGRVVDGNGQPAPWAEVHAYADKQTMWNEAGGRHLVADGAGEFRIDGLPPTTIRLVASTADAASSQPRHIDLAPNHDVTDVSLVVDLDGEISGVVIDAQHKPIAGVAVICQPAEAKRVAVRCPGFETTDADGKFHLGGLGGGTYKLVATRSGGSHPAAEVTARTGDDGVQIAVDNLGSISGHLRYSDGTVPDKAHVELQPGRGHTAVVGADGAFAIDQLDAGAFTLLATGGFVTAKQDGVRVAPGQRVDIGTITVERGRILEGSVVDDAGAPVIDARVTASASLRGSAAAEGLGVDLGAAVTATDDHGQFRLTAVPLDATLVVADHPRRGRSAPTPVTDGSMRLVLHSVGSVEGVVAGVDHEGGCFVSVESTKDGLHYGASCDQRGKYRIARIGEGDYHVQVNGPGRLAGLSRDITVAAGQSQRVDF